MHILIAPPLHSTHWVLRRAGSCVLCWVKRTFLHLRCFQRINTKLPQIATQVELGVMANIPGHLLCAENDAKCFICVNSFICALQRRKLWPTERRSLIKDHEAGQWQAGIWIRIVPFLKPTLVKANERWSFSRMKFPRSWPGCAAVTKRPSWCYSCGRHCHCHQSV